MTVITPQQYAIAQRKIANDAENALRGWLTRNPHASPAAVQREAARLIAQHGAAAAQTAKAYYVAERRAVPELPRYRATAHPELDNVDVALRLRESYDQADELRGLGPAVNRLVEQAGRQTITRNARRDPAAPRWARVPIGPTCAWCLMLASRGAVFLTEASAGGGRGGTVFHPYCDCQPVPVWPGQSPPYDVAALRDIYVQARVASGDRVLGTTADGRLRWARPDDDRLVTAALRQHFPGMVNDGAGPTVLREIPSLPNLYERTARAGANPSHGQHNCQRVVHAYELRRRGYDVAAVNGHGRDAIGKGWADLMDGLDDRLVASRRFLASTDVHLSDTAWRTTPDALDYVRGKAAQWPVGARGYVVLDRAQRSEGHVFNIERTAEGLVVREAQNPDKSRSLPEWLSQITSQDEPADPDHWRGGSVMIARVDDLRFNTQVTEAITWTGKRP